MANFIVQFPLKTEKYQEDILDKRFEIGRQMYHSLVNITQKRYKEMIQTRKYRILLSSLSNDKKKEKEIWNQINEIRKQYGMSEYSFHEDVKQMQKHFKENMDAFTAQKIAGTLWKAYDKLFFGKGITFLSKDIVHFILLKENPIKQEYALKMIVCCGMDYRYQY